MTRLIIALIILTLIPVSAVAAAEEPNAVGGECRINSIEPYTGKGQILWQDYPADGEEWFATMNLLDTRTGGTSFYEVNGWASYDGDMTFFYQLERGHVWKVSEVTCYVIYPSGSTGVSAPTGITWYIDTRWRAWIPLLRVK